MSVPLIFISYSHKNKTEKDALLTHLGPLTKYSSIESWSDDRIAAGEDWEQRISQVMNRASAAILLITANFLNSEFIDRKEVPRLLKRRKGEGLTVFPVIARQCAWRQVEWLTRMNVRPENGKPVWGSGRGRVDKELTAIVDELADVIKKAKKVTSSSSLTRSGRRALGRDVATSKKSAKAIRVSGVVRIDGNAKLTTKNGNLILIPYPLDAPVDKTKMEWDGREIFTYLDKQEATVLGELVGSRLFNARIATSRSRSIDFALAPQRHDRFSKQIERYFKKDSQQIAEKLNDAGIMTISAFYHRIKNYGPEISSVSAYLGVPENAIKKFLHSIEEDTRNRSLITAPPKSPVTRGANPKKGAGTRRRSYNVRAYVEPPRFPDSERTSQLPPKVDLTKQVTGVKDQGPYRGTDVAFAAVALLEFELINRGAQTRMLDLSEQYLYWACKQIDGAPNDEGTFMEYAMMVLKSGVPRKKLLPGVCKERDWPYNRAPIPGNEAHDPPPAAAVNAEKYRVSKYKRLNHTSIKEMKTALASNQCIGLSVYTYHFWTDGYVWQTGIIPLPIGVNPDGAHAICVVGYEDSDDTHTDGYFIFKNSWGTNWGAGRPDPGFGSLPYRYLLKESIEAWTVEL